jgi:hypothetical protein
MKKLVLLSFFTIFFMFLSFTTVLSTQYTLQEGESIVFNGRTIRLSGVSSNNQVVVTSNDISKAINKGETKTFNDLEIKVVDIYYYPNEQQVSSAILEILQLINKTCTDSDGGLDYYTKGTVSICTYYEQGGGCGLAVDSCDGNILTEGYCEGNESKTVKYTCSYGCSDGACIKEPINVKIGLGGATCTIATCSVMKAYNKVSIDDDIYTIEGGTFIYVNTTIGKHTFKALDTIVNNTGGKFNFVRWTHITRPGEIEYCYANPCTIEITGTSIDVTPSYSPATIPTCVDSDGGKNYYIKGTVTKGTAVSSDCCAVSRYSPDCVSSSDYLAERFCDSQDNLNTEIVYCTNGCKDGACVGETTTTIPGRCVNHDECSQACDYLGTDKWQYSRRWYGTCPYGVYGCMTGDCCLGQCTDKGECFCLHTNVVDIYGDVCPYGTTCGDDCYCHPITDGTKTKIDITSPRDGQTVSGSVRVVAEASSTYELGEMTLSIQKTGENIARAITFTSCAEGASICPVGQPCVKHYIKTCNYDWDTSGYDGVVLLTATITDNNYNKATNSIKVNVVNYQSCNDKCESMGYRYGTCKNLCDVGEIKIESGCPQVACAPCIEGQPCPPCPVNYCCCAGKKPCPYECCVNDPDYQDKSCPVASCPVCKPGEECPPCIQAKCIDYKCSWHPQEEYAIKFKEGWNMFSFPVDIRSYLTATSQTTATQMTVENVITGHAVETQPIEEIPPERQCQSPNHVWHYSNGKYVDVLNDPSGFVNGWSYWVKMDSECMVKMTGNKVTIEDFPELEAGWNQIGAPSESINFYSIIGDCNLLSGPWWFNSASNKFEKAQVFKPGEGYFVKVKDKCKLGSEIPPPPPEELGLGQAFRTK